MKSMPQTDAKQQVAKLVSFASNCLCFTVLSVLLRQGWQCDDVIARSFCEQSRTTHNGRRPNMVVIGNYRGLLTLRHPNLFFFTLHCEWFVRYTDRQMSGAVHNAASCRGSSDRIMKQNTQNGLKEN